MDHKSKALVEKRKANVAKRAEPRSLPISENVKTGSDFARLMSALMSDIISGRVTPSVGNAACNAGGKLLKVVEMQNKFGNQAGGNHRVLTLVPDQA